MKAMRLTGIRALRMFDVPDPEIQTPHDVRLRLLAVGVCGSDVHYYTTGRIGSQVVQYPFTVGHECAAVVEAVGSAVTLIKPGDRVVVESAMPCWTCDQCRAGRPHTCRKLRFLGCPGQAEGCLSERLVMPEACCLPMPATMTAAQAALVEPLAIGLYAVRQSVPIHGAAIGILGCGPIGFSVLLSAQAQGMCVAYVTDKLDPRLALARQAGAVWIGNPERVDVVREIVMREPGLLDVVFECCGEQSALDQAVALLKPGGKLMLIGIPAVERVSFVMDSLRRKELCLQNVRRQNHCTQATLDMVARGELRVDFMVTHRFPFERTPEAFDLVAHYRNGVVKAMIEMDKL